MLRLAPKYSLAHYSLKLKFLPTIPFNWWRLLVQPITLEDSHKTKGKSISM